MHKIVRVLMATVWGLFTIRKVQIHMARLQEPFEIAYCGVTIIIFPVINGSNMKYIVRLPTRYVTIETVFDEDEIDFWQEVPGGQTILAEEIGAIIAERDM